MGSEKKIENGWSLVGNEHIAEYFERILTKNNLSGTYIFLGPQGLGKSTAAYTLARKALCEAGGEKKGRPCGECASCKQMGVSENEGVGGKPEGFEAVHSDLHLIRRDPTKKNIAIDQVREFIRVLSMSSFLNSYKIGIVKDADTLSSEAANALLKTLEEPKKKVVIILIATDLENIPDTVVSRSRVLNFRPVPRDLLYDHLLESYNTDRDTAKELSRLSLGRPALAIKLLEDREFYKEYLEQARVFFLFFSSDMNARFEAVEKMFGSGSSGMNVTESAKGTLECWAGIVRDIILFRSRNENFIQHGALLEEMEKAGKKVGYQDLVNIHRLLEKGKERLEANVNPVLVLEDIACNIKT